MRIASAAILTLLAASAPQPQRQRFAVVVSAYVPHHGGSNSNSHRTAFTQNGGGPHSSRLGYRNSADTVYEEETIQERIHRVRSGQMSEAEKQNFLNSALGNPHTSLTGADTGTDTSPSSSTTTTTTSGWSHPSYSPPRYITVPLNEKSKADEKRKYLEMVMNPNRFKSYGNVGATASTSAATAAGGGSGSSSSGGMESTTTTANSAELNEVQEKIRLIEEKKRRMEAIDAERVARDKAAKEASEIETARKKLQAQQRAEKERKEEEERFKQRIEAEKQRVEAERKKRQQQTDSALADRLAKAAEEAERKRIADLAQKRKEEEEAKKKAKEEAEAAAKAAADQQRIEQERIKAEKEEADRQRLERIAAAEAQKVAEGLELQRIEEARRIAAERAEKERIEEAKRQYVAQKEAEMAAKLEQQRMEEEEAMRIAAAEEEAERQRIQAEKEERIARAKAAEERFREQETIEAERIASEKEAVRVKVEQAAAEEAERARVEQEQLLANSRSERLEEAKRQYLAEQQEAKVARIEEEKKRFADEAAKAAAEEAEKARPAELSIAAAEQRQQHLEYEHTALKNLSGEYASLSNEPIYVPSSAEELNMFAFSILESMKPPVIDTTSTPRVLESSPNILEQPSTIKKHVDVDTVVSVEPKGSSTSITTERAYLDDVPQEPIGVSSYLNNLSPGATISLSDVKQRRPKAFNTLRERLDADTVERTSLEAERAKAEFIAARKAAEQERLKADRIAVEKKAEQERVEAERIAAEERKTKRMQAIRAVAEVAEQLKANRMADKSRIHSVPNPSFFKASHRDFIQAPQVEFTPARPNNVALDEEVENALKLANDALTAADEVIASMKNETPITRIANVAAKGSLYLGAAAAVGTLQLGASAAKAVWGSIVGSNKVWDRSANFSPSDFMDDNAEWREEIGNAIKRAKKAWVARYGQKWD
mmetsp:Transcript_11755/g.25471  ORF Transcript_11755/g.25471 Transcript_11755/m.25471 type:complete len:945 (-) Transcript_11755:416-3250(-)